MFNNYRIKRLSRKLVLLRFEQLGCKDRLDNDLATKGDIHAYCQNAAKIAKKAHAEGKTLKAAALELKLVSEADFAAWVRPEDMTGAR